VAQQPDDRLKEALDRLLRAELVFGRGEVPEAVYTFKHALVQEAAYASLLRERRRQLQARIAEALEGEGFDTADLKEAKVLLDELGDLSVRPATGSLNVAAISSGSTSSPAWIGGTAKVMS
jgi:hypothetical protein